MAAYRRQQLLSIEHAHASPSCGFSAFGVLRVSGDRACGLATDEVIQQSVLFAAVHESGIGPSGHGSSLNEPGLNRYDGGLGGRNVT
jgi:hypothetical protein